jgi:[acyl-carrier-protein] S-malonyltransferase
VEIIQAMIADNVTHIFECGPGRVLSGLTKRIAPDVESAAINDAESLREALALSARS